MAWITAHQALAALGIKAQTLYANVSRKRIRAKADPKDSRRSVYHSEDVRRLAGRRSGRRTVAAVAADAMGWGDPVLTSSITTVADGRLWYRGRDAIALAESASLEEIAALLWEVPEVEIGGSGSREYVPHLALQSGHLALQAGQAPLQSGLVLLATRAGGDPPSRGRSRAVLTTEAGQLVGDMAEAMLGETFLQLPRRRKMKSPSSRMMKRIATGSKSADSPKHWRVTDGSKSFDSLTHRRAAYSSNSAGAPMHRRMAAAWKSPSAADALRRALVLLADHELNASTFATRVAISTGAPLSGGLLAGLATLTGPLHGGASAGVQALAAAARRTTPSQAVRDWLARGDLLPGFGHPLYPDGDPRAVALLNSFEPGDTHAELCQVVESVTGEFPNVDFAIAALADAYRLPSPAPLTLFALARSVGWIAHALEQLSSGNLIRPRARYSGPPLGGLPLR